MTKNLRNIALPLLIFMNIYGGFLEKNINISRHLFLIAPIFLIIISIVVTSKVHINRFAILFFAGTSLICMFQIALLKNTQVFSTLFYCCIFLLTCINYRPENLWLISKTIVFVSVLMTCEALYYYQMLLKWGWPTYNVRNFTAAPKEDYTIILSLSFMVLLVLVLYHELKLWKKISIISLMTLELFTNIFIMQSKTALLLPVIALLVIYNKCKPKTKRKIRKIFIIAFFLIGIFFILGNKYIPDFIYVFINRYTGLFSNKLSLIDNISKYSGSYEQRGSIYKFCLELFINYPVLGIGFGRIIDFASLSSNTYISELGQAESGIISAFVEGGMFYGILYLFIICYPVIRIVKSIKKAVKIEDINLLFLFSITLFICCLTNDCKSITFWIMVSLLYAHQGILYASKAI